MKLTQQQLMQAVRAAGAGRESFTCADVREQLGLSAKDRQKANQFYRAFRALQAEASNEIEKLATNCYRLRVSSPEIGEALEAEVIEVERSELSEVEAPSEAPAALAVPIDAAIELASERSEPELVAAEPRSEELELDSAALQGSTPATTEAQHVRRAR